MAAAAEYVNVAKSLHPRLFAFFRKYPPPSVAALSRDEKTRRAGLKALAAAAKPSPSTASASETDVADGSSSLAPVTPRQTPLVNPFVAWKHPVTQRWCSPRISLRRQSDLYKIAARENLLPLLPIGPKHPEVREQKRVENGLRVQGTGVGKTPKGKMWERGMRIKLDERRKAMENMPALIREWKQKGHGRGWKKWPK